MSPLCCFMLFFSGVLLLYVYQWYSKRFTYWKKKGVQGPEPVIIGGNMSQLFTKNKSLGMQFQGLYEETKHLPFAGIYLFHRPALLINDLDLIKSMFVKDFDHFMDHGLDFDKNTQPLTHHLHNINGEKWRDLRSKLTAAFTTSKLKQMLRIMESNSKNMIMHLEKLVNDQVNVDMREVVAKYTTDIIVNCAFGIESDSFKDPAIRNISKDIFKFNLRKKIILLTSLFAPDIQKCVNAKIFDKDITNYFVKKIDEIVKYREKNNIERNDIMQSLIKLKNSENNLTLLEITALAFGFFVGGYETSSSTSSFLFFEIAKNREIQRKLVEEIDHMLKENDNKITYEALNSMTYMYQVLDETLRKYPPIPQLFRLCTKDYTIPNTNILIEKGTPIYVSPLGIHKNPEYYDDPETFNPDRFSAENKRQRHNFAFIPFGEGPRMCIGNKLAYLQIGVALVTILRDFHVDITGDCALNVTRNSLLLQPNVIKLKLTHRKKRQ